MNNVTVIFNDNSRTNATYSNVIGVIVHVYGFLELDFSDGTNEQFNMSSIFSFKSDFTVTNPPMTSKKK